MEFVLPELFERLVAQLAADPFGPADARCQFLIYGDGKELFQSLAVSPADQPVPVSVPELTQSPVSVIADAAPVASILPPVFIVIFAAVTS